MKTKSVKRILVIYILLTLMIPVNCLLNNPVYSKAQELGILSKWLNPSKVAPDYYGGMEYVASKEAFVVYLKENTEENQKTILDGTPNSMNIIFASCKYSQNELQAVEKELYSNWKDYEGLSSFGIGMGDLSWGCSEPRLHVRVLEENYEVVSKKLIEKYGDKIIVKVGEPIVPSVGIPNSNSTNENKKTSVSKKVVIKTAKLNKKKIEIKWKKLSSAKKYKVTIINKKGKQLVSKVTKKTSYTYKIRKKLAKKYTVKIKAYDTKTKSWGKWTTKVVKRK